MDHSHLFYLFYVSWHDLELLILYLMNIMYAAYVCEASCLLIIYN